MSEDLTGRRRMPLNVLAGWAGQLVFVAAGFVLPRLIDTHVGQTGLGIWDFSWSLVSYFSLAQAGISASVSRHVAEYRARGDVAGLNRMISSACAIEVVAAALVLLLTIVVSRYVPAMLGASLEDQGAAARAVVLLLGAGLAVQVSTNAFSGVVTGCHRWDVHIGINAGLYAVTVAAMIFALENGGGLPELAVANFCGTALTETVRVLVSARICPELRVDLRLATLAEARRVIAFGAKSITSGISSMILYQTNALLVAGTLGAGALALYARPNALLRHSQTFMDRFAFLLSPTASSYDATGRRDELRGLLVQSGRIAAFLALPVVAFLAVLGDPLLRLWMGQRYEEGAVLAILAIGHLPSLVQQPLFYLLVGMNLHGRPGLLRIGASLVSVGLGAIFVGWLHLGLTGAALAVVIPLSIVNGLAIPLYACRQLEIPARSYFAQTLAQPLVLTLPFLACLLAIRTVCGDDPLTALGLGALAGVIVVGPLYWRTLLPESTKTRIVCALSRRSVPVPVPEPDLEYASAPSSRTSS